ncbi:MAG: DUF5312 domain-containing protein [Spirochaetaceae bacterium]|jgi:hypothetical protein|nr:DUF5312 domain-containing protein [Spirochaetaceae bacterium]
MAESLFKKILGLFSGEKDPDFEKKKLLKEITKDLTTNKYSKFYRPKSEEIDASMGKFFYDIYWFVTPAQVFMTNADKSTQLKHAVIEAFMDESLVAIGHKITPESIAEQAKTKSAKDLSASIKSNINALKSAFDTNRIKNINRCYNLILTFHQFVNYSFYNFVKVFDNAIVERSFTYKPSFVNVRAAKLSDYLKDFIEISYQLDPALDWKAAFNILKKYKGEVDVLNVEQWSKLLIRLQDIHKSGIFLLIVRHADQNPVWQFKPITINEDIAEQYLDSTITEAQESLSKIISNQKNAKIDQLAKTVFGSLNTSCLANYTDKANEVFAKKELDGFTRTADLNYLKAFIVYRYKQDIYELADLFLVRGQWTANELFHEMSEATHSLDALLESIAKFDESISDRSERGGRLRAALSKFERDKSQAKYVKMLVKDINAEAENIVSGALWSLVIIGKHLKGIIDDYNKNPHELIINWRELEMVADISVLPRLVDSYKKFFTFVQMMQILNKPTDIV